MNKKLSPLLIIVILWVLILPLIKWGWEYEWTKISFSAMAAGAFFIYAVLIKKAPDRIPHSAYFIPFIGVWIIISIFFSAVPAKGFVEIIKVTGPFFIYPAMLVLSPDKHDMELISLGIAIAIIISTTIGMLQLSGIYGYITADQYGRANAISTFGLSNFAGEYIAGAIPLLITMFIFRRYIWHAVILSIAIIEGIAYIIIAHTRSAWVALAVVTISSIILLIYIRKKRHLNINFSPLYIAGIVVAGGLLLSVIFRQTDSFLKYFVSIFSIHYPDNLVRLLTWKSILTNLFPAHPFMGIGFGAFESIFPAYSIPSLSMITFANHVTMNYAHNEYLNILSETGIIGFILVCAFILYVLRDFWRSISTASDTNLPLLLGSFLGFISLLVIAVFSFPFRMPSTGLLFWMYAGICGLYLNKTGKIKPDIWKIIKYILIGLSLFVFVISLRMAIARRAYLYTNTMFKHGHTMYEQMENKLTDAIRLAPFNENYFFDRAMIRIKLGNSEGAINDLKDTINLSPYYLQARRWLGILYSNKGSYRLAAKQLDKAYRLSYFSPVVQAKIIGDQAVVLIRQGDDKQALNILRNAQSLDPQNYTFFKLRGEAYEHLSMYKDAGKAYSNALQLNPGKRDVIADIASLYIRTKRYKKAITLLKSVKNPDSYVYYNLASAYARIDDYRNAKTNIALAISGNKKLYLYAIKDPDLVPIHKFIKGLD